MKVSKQERVLLVMANLTTHGRQDLKWAYRWLDANAVGVARLILGLLYRRVEVLTGEDATVDQFVDRLAALAADPRTRAVDVLLHLHGEERKLWFVEGTVSTSELRGRIVEKCPRGKLRLLYSTACYGASHAPDWIASGFQTASGAIGVNTNGPYDYPVQLLCWGLDVPYERALRMGNNRLMATLHDRLAARFRFKDVNSIKTLVGEKRIRISSPSRGSDPTSVP